jgi:two-component system, OmpR family, sensor histidine kinase VicK
LKEITKVIYGVQNVTNTVLQFLSETNNTVDACVDYTRPSLIVGIMALKEAFLNVKKRGVKLRYVTEIKRKYILLQILIDSSRRAQAFRWN